MSYDPSYRMPPRQERWPNATPAEGWPSYRDGDEADRRSGADRRDAHPPAAGHRQAGRHAAVATATFPPAGNGYGSAPDTYGHGQAANGYGEAGNGYGQAANGYGEAGNGYSEAAIGYGGGYGATGTAAYRTGAYPGGGYGGTVDGYAADSGGYPAGADDSFDGYNRTEAGYGPAAATAYAPEYDWTEHGYAGTEPGYAAGPGDFAGNYLGPGSYIEPGLADPAYSADPAFSADPVLRGDPGLTAPDAGVRPDRWLADLEYRREASWRGPVVAAVMEVLAIGVVIGVSTLAAGLLKARTSPVGAMGTVFIDRTPAVLRNFALHHFGAHGRAVLLLGMYAAFAVVAIVVGVLARRATAAGVAGVVAFTLFAEFVVITRPGGHVADIAPAIIGGMAGVAALLWLFRASAPTLRPDRSAPLRPELGRTRRRNR
jgi:hypothetical protein